MAMMPERRVRVTKDKIDVGRIVEADNSAARRSSPPTERGSYHSEAVDAAIRASRQRIGRREAKLIHAVLKGRE
jgi:hypothetical protein